MMQCWCCFSENVSLFYGCKNNYFQLVEYTSFFTKYYDRNMDSNDAMRCCFSQKVILLYDCTSIFSLWFNMLAFYEILQYEYLNYWCNDDVLFCKMLDFFMVVKQIFPTCRTYHFLRNITIGVWIAMMMYFSCKKLDGFMIG